MFLLSPDESFHFELLRTLAASRYFGADVGEVLEAANHIEAGNFQSFYQVFKALATRVNDQADRIDVSKNPVSARDAYFRASTYFRAADFYLHGNPQNPEINALWKKQTITFDKAIDLLPNPAKRLILKGDGFDIPVIYFRSAVGGFSTPKPTLILGNGYDGAQEEMLHVTGFAALERGYNVITYEGPGQPTVRREQELGFISEWEKVVTPVVDYLVGRNDVDSKRIGLFGYSLGGFLAVRAAAFEHRLAAVIAVDGVYDFSQAFSSKVPPQMRPLLDSGEPEKIDSAIREMLARPNIPTSVRWGLEQGAWSFNVTSFAEYLVRTRTMSLKGLHDQIHCPVWVGDAGEDEFFKGQPEQVRDALGDKATYVKLTADDAAGHHCHVGAGVLMNQLVLDWFGDVISTR